ncbi:hypothetical protein CPC16_004055 [Podila verticillata]|nr:hypothetical protein CPC16_004055 [Podila verticillata]
METSELTILLFFILVILLLAAFILYLFIIHRTTPISQRLALWLKAQNEADQLVETMAAQAHCVLEGLRPFRRREKMKKKRIAAARRRQQQLDRGGGGARPGGSGSHPDNDEVILQTVLTSADDDAMDEIWRRQQQYRSDRTDGHQDGTSHKGDGSGAPSGGGSNGNNSSTDQSRSSEDLASERLWEFVAGWCMVGCIFAGIALIVGANTMVQNNPATETQWTFDTEDGDSLMDSIINHIMKIALGIKDFEDQLMEHGIFVFVAGINGFVLVRQKIFVRRRQYEIDLQGGMVTMESIGSRGRECYDEENALEGGSNSSGRASGDCNDRSTSHHDACTQEILQTVKETDSKNMSPRDSESKDKETDKDKDKLDAGATDGDSPDFHTMSFLAWFNYLQVGILIIEFLQLFSFPLRELMEFYNQAEKTSTMYESAKGIMNVFQAATANGASAGSNGNLTQFVTQGLQGLHYHDGVLAFGNSTLFNFNTGTSNNDSVTVASTTSGSVPIQEILNALNKTGTTNMAQRAPGAHDWMDQMPMLDNATAYITPWIKDANVTSQWIADNLPTWLPNITSHMLNSTHSITAETQKQLEDVKKKIVQAAADATVKGISTIATTISSLNGTSVFGNATLADGASTAPGQSHESAPSKEMESDGDIVMQVVNSLGLQPSINTHDWYLLRFWSCFAVVVAGWFVALTIHAWNRRCRRLRREGKPHWPASVLYLPILSTFLSSAACQSQAIHAYAHEQYAQQQAQARREGHGSIATAGIFNSIVMTLLDPASTVIHPASSLLCTGPQVRPSLYLAASLLAYTLAYLLFMVFLTSFERVPGKGEICFRPNGVAVLKNLGLLLAVDFLLIQSPAQRRFRGLVSISIMLAMACYTIKMKPCYWNKINYWRTFSFSCVLYASLLVALLCPSPAPDKVKGERRGGKWVMAPHLKMGHAWTVGGGPKVMLAWIAAGWVILIIVFFVAERVFLRQWTKKNPVKKPVQQHPYLNME